MTKENEQFLDDLEVTGDDVTGQGPVVSVQAAGVNVSHSDDGTSASVSNEYASVNGTDISAGAGGTRVENDGKTTSANVGGDEEIATATINRPV